ncbi:MAG: transposase, family [Pseudomonadota bacterium]|jgi:transposase-like protein|nr:transposase, family [Pseudomonadota bacterium]
MNNAHAFKWRHFQDVIILQCVRWYLKYSISYRDLEDMMSERGVIVDHSTIYRWVMKYAHELKQRSAWYCRNRGYSWRVDETYVKVKGKWKYLYRAITKEGDTVDFYLSHTRNTKAAKRFLSKALKINKYWVPHTINTDLNPAYNQAIADIKAENQLHSDIQHRKVKYLNNNIESDHGKLKRLIKPMLGFKTMRSANSTITGYEVMRMFKKGQFDFWMNLKGKNEIQFINELFGVNAG